MKSNGPSYLFKNRFGVFHFRARIPENVRTRYQLTKKVIQKSLNTKNRREALDLARRWWVKMTDIDWILDLERKIEIYDEKLLEGRRIHSELKAITDDPEHLPSDVDSFFEFLTPDQIEAFECYENHLVEQKIQDKQPIQHVENVQEGTMISNSTITLSIAYEKFVKSKSVNWEDNNRKKSRSIFNQFVKIVGDIPCCDLKIEQMITFRDTIMDLPKRVDLPPYNDMSYNEILEMDIPLDKIPTRKTLKNKFRYILSFLKYCENNFYVDINYNKPFAHLYENRKSKDSKERVPYDDDLKKLFESVEYVNGSHKSAAHHWIPLIGLFTGARLNEICQLTKTDICYHESSNIWYFDFNRSGKNKKIKTDAGIRFVPIHQQLIKLGFLEFCKTIGNDNLLFPKPVGQVMEIKDTISKWYNRTYKSNCRIIIPIGAKKDFHSLRNTFINNLKQRGIPVKSAKEIVGHESDDMTYGQYASSHDLPARKKIVDQVKYPSIDFSRTNNRIWKTHK